MSGWVAGAIALTGVTSAVLSSDASSNAADASVQASQTQAGYQQQALDYLKQRNALPDQVRDQALTGLSGYYKVPGQPMTQQQLIDQAKNSPLYNAEMGNLKTGQDLILRNAAATGGLRSGNVQTALTDYGQQTANRALLDSYNKAQEEDRYNIGLNLTGLKGLADIPTNDTAVASGTSNIGTTLAQGQVAGAQANQVGAQNSINDILGSVGLGLKAYSAFYNPLGAPAGGAPGFGTNWY